MKTNQTYLFTGKRMQLTESIQLTIESLLSYCTGYDHWSIAWSGGKDSTTLLTLVIWLLETKQIPRPKSITVLYADTRLELTPLSIAAYNIIGQLKDKGYNVQVVMAEMDKRFMVYMLGRGVPPPNNNTLRWCTQQIKIKPMEMALQKLHTANGKMLMLTGVRQGESAIRDSRIIMSCSKDGAECGQGWFQKDKSITALADTLAPLLHWRVCHVWDWLKIGPYAFGYDIKGGHGFNTAIIADAYGGDEAEEINARTGCVGCPLAKKDTALDTIIKNPNWSYLQPLKELRSIYEWLRLKQNRHRKNGELNKDGKLSSNPQRLGPIKLTIRMQALEKILDIQYRVNEAAIEAGRPRIDLINPEEESRIRELIEMKQFPNKWTGDEIGGEEMITKIYNDGTKWETLFGN